jgi:hypothetical protein
MIRLTKDDRKRVQVGMPESDKQMMNEMCEHTGHHEPDDAEMPFESNYNDGNEDWLEP